MVKITFADIVVVGVVTLVVVHAVRARDPVSPSPSPVVVVEDVIVPPPQEQERNAALVDAPDDELPIAVVPLETSPVWGPDDAAVTIVEVSEIGCAFCPRAQALLSQIREKQGRDVRFVWKSAGRPLKTGAAIAEELLLSIGDIERFLPLYQKWMSGVELDEATVYRDAEAAGLSRSAVETLLASGRGRDRITRDRALAKSLGVTETPTFFINGIRVSGRDPMPAWQNVIDRERARAHRLVDQGVEGSELYATLQRRSRAGSPPELAPRRVVAAGETRQNISPAPHAPRRGASDASVVISMWSDFGCENCGRVTPLLDTLFQTYPNVLAVEFRHLPREGSPRSRAAAAASMAAHAQASFWRYAALLEEHPLELEEKDLLAYAKRTGLDLKRFNRDRQLSMVDATFERDREEGLRVGVRGAPTFFVNGVPIRGVQPLDVFRSVIDAELLRARLLTERGVVQSEVSATILREESGKSAATDAPVERRVAIDTKEAPRFGPKRAKVEVVVFSDFECPACQSVGPHLMRAQASAPDRVAIVFKQYPLPNHLHAEGASVASLAAQRQGRFWEMHDRLFAHSDALSPAALMHHAKAIGLNLSTFRRDLADPALHARVKADIAEGVKLGITGTPTLFVNGRRLEGGRGLESLLEAVAEISNVKTGNSQR